MKELTPEQKRELLAKLLRERAAQGAAARATPSDDDHHQRAAAAAPMRAIPRGGDLPLSFGQERVWFQEEMQPEILAHNVLVRVGLSGRLDIDVLRRSIEVVVGRHEALRATFPTVDGVPVVRIMPLAPWPLPVADLRNVPESDRESEARRLTTEAAKARFNLTTGPLLKSLVLRLGHEEYILVLVVHHIVTDGWSIDLFLREMTSVYGAFISGTTPNLPELPVQYADFAQWQREWLSGDVFETHRAYWAKKLAGPLPVLDLPIDRRPAAATTLEGSTRHALIEGPVLDGLRELSRREGVTLFATVLAAVNTLLHRYAAQDDIVVGTYVAGRARGEIDSLIGFFVNTLVLRTDLSGDPTFREALRRTRDVVLDANTHAGFPYEKLLEELRPQRSLNRAPLFQVIFNFLGFGYDADLSLAGLRVQSLPALDFHATTENLTIQVFDRKSSLEFTLIYNAQLFDAGTIELFLDHLRALLAGIVAHPEARLSALPLLGPAERHRLLVELNSGETTFPADQCFPVYFEEQVRRTPDAIAVEDDHGTLTYSELNVRANRVARTLVSAGVGPGQAVALLAERGRTLLTWILATLKAGGVYLPIDPRYPAGRHASILRQSGAGIVLVTDELAGRLDEAIAGLPAPAPRVFRSGDLAADGGDVTDLPPRARPEDIAYIIFTSGSTGSPKGAMVPHRAMLNHFWSKIRGLGITSADVILQSAPQGFDISIWQFLAGLLTGARIVIAPDSISTEPERLFAFIERDGITLAQVVPSFLRAFLDESPHAAGVTTFGRLRWIVLAGEALPPELCRQWLACWPHTPMVNAYGPSECADITTEHFITDPPREDELHVPIGRPIHNARVYIIDDHHALAPQGVAGELYIGGAGVGAGYVNDPERTAASFVPDPFSDVSGTRMYRTGDRARIRHDGAAEYLGRTDHQVKIRGLRIELGEIEVVLAQHPMVKEAVVSVWQGPQGPRLVAYLVLSGPTVTAIADILRSHVRATLPRYMVPDSFVIMPSLPLSANGKINRAALPAPEGPGAEAPAISPRTRTEEIIARVWADVLGLDRVGINENFFELGGHSLIATRVAARLRKAFHVDFSVRRIFEAQTVAELAVSIDADASRGSGAVRRPGDGDSDLHSLLETRPDQRFDPFPLTDVQEAYWIGRGGGFEMGNIATHAYVELDIEGLDIDLYERVWQRLIDRHDMLRAIVRPDGQQQVLEHTPPFVIKRQDLSGRSPDAAEAAIATIRAELSHQILPTDRWPLFEIRSSKLTASRYRIHLSFDMLIGDAWSFAVLQRDFDRLYLDPDADLDPIDISFRDYVLAMVRFRETDDYNRSLAYWDAQSRSLPARPDLPLAKDPASIDRPRFVRRHGNLDRDEWGALQQKAKGLGISHNGLILTAFVDVLATWSKGSRFLLNLTLFNRVPVHPHVDEIFGDFTSITLLDVALLPDESFVDLAKRLLGRLWEDLDHRFVSGVQVLRRLARAQPDRVNGAAPVVLTSTIGFEGASREPSELARRSELKFAISQTSQVWLDQMVTVDDGQLIVNWDVVEELFPAGMIDDMFAAYMGHLKRLARDDAAWLEPRVRRAGELLPAWQRRQRALVNATERPVRQTLLHVLFEEQAAARPDQLAIVSGKLRLTYTDTCRLSRRLGTTLREIGARPNELVAIVMEKGWEQVVAALAVLQSGAAYVPIDANLPDERRVKLVENAGVKCVLTQPGLVEKLTWPSGIRVLSVEPPANGAGDVPPVPPVQRPEDLAYVIYTSGSTGLPKGVMIDHRGAVNTVLDMNDRFAVQPHDRVLALSSLSFDLSVYDIFGMLAAGGTIVIPEATATRDPERWTELVEREGVTIWNSVPALMEMFVEYRAGRSAVLPPSLRLILLSGDWIPVTLPAQIRALSASIQLMSLGGATEASIWSIVYPIENVEADWKSIPYGRPMVNQTFHVLDESFEPRPVWVPGQLFIGGIGVSMGYWRDEEKTKAKFVTHPRTGKRLYATGDLGRYLPSGDIEFLGREDFQVKIRGFRIELGEIEAAFRQHPSVRSVVVTAVGKTTAERRLLAYVIPQPAGDTGSPGAVEPDAAAMTRLGLEATLLEFLATKLPEHMCPARVVLLDQLPLTANGKVDLRSLPVPGTMNASGEPLTEPRTDAEGALVDVWKEVLRINAVGIRDNFFDLGGDSVSAIQVVSRIVRRGYQLSPVLLFRYPTVAELAPKLTSATPASGGVDEITI